MSHRRPAIPLLLLLACALARIVLSDRAAEANNRGYRCRDPLAERIRSGLAVSYDLAKRKRTLQQCIAKRWPDRHSGKKDLWILGIVERTWPSQGGEHILQLFVAERRGRGFRLHRRSARFAVEWADEPKWQQRISRIDVERGPVGHRPVFGVVIRANYSFKMASHWYEKLVLFEVDSMVEPLFSTVTGDCDCRRSDEAYPRDCFMQRTCPGAFRSATVTRVQRKTPTGSRCDLLKTCKPDGTTMVFKWWPHLRGWSADPLAEPKPVDVRAYPVSDRYY